MTGQSTATAENQASPRQSRFRNPDDGRLKAGWRIVAFLAIFYALALPMIFGLRAVIGFSKSSPWVIVIIAASAIPAVYIARRWIDGKRFASLGLEPGKRSATGAVFGFLLSGVMAGIVFVAMATLGFVDNVHIAPVDAAAARVLVGSVLLMMLVGFWEELVFRGYILQNMAEGMGMKVAVLVSCLLYGLIHAANPNAGILSTAIIVLFGYLRIYGYLITGQLWLSFGMHAGWNFFQATVFGYAASGHAEDWTLFTHDSAAASWLSGGAFGPEASVLTVPVVVLALFAMRWWSTAGAPPSRRTAAVS